MKKFILKSLFLAVMMIVGTATSWADANTYSIAGSPASVFGASWDEKSTATDMTFNAETELYEWSKADVTLAEGTVKFKVVVNHDWTEAYPESDYQLAIAEDGVYDIAITFNAETKAVNATATKKGEAVVEKTYTIAGTPNLFGTSWDVTDANNNMTLNAKTGLYEWSKTGVELNSDVEFKVVMNNAWANSWPASNYVLEITEVATYDVVITFNADSKEITATATKKTSSLNTYTASFTTNAGWTEVYAYAWTTENENTTEFLGPWPGTKLEKTDDVYVVTIDAAAAPANIIFNSGNGAQTADLVFEDGKAYAFTISDEWLAAINDAAAIANENGIAVGKLLAAIAKAQGQTGSDEDKTALLAAVDQYKKDNSDQESDQTAKVATNGWKNFNGGDAGVCATKFAPPIDTYDGRKNVQLAEVYEGSVEGVNRTGTIIYQDITGLKNGTYKVGFYGNAFYTSGRGFDSPMEDGAEDVAYVFANEQKAFITANIATSTTTNNFRQFDVEVTDGTIKLGMGKEKAGTNWHTMQIYQLTWFATAKEVYASDKAEMTDAIAAAEALKTAARTEGVEEFDAALAAAQDALSSNMLNIDEFEAEIAKLKDAAKAFVKANYFIDLADGAYYVIAAESGKMMAAGHNYGTRGIVNETGLDLNIKVNAEPRTVSIDSRVSNGGNDHFLGKNLYMDSSEWGWALEHQGYGFFYIANPEDGKYINLDDDDNLVLSDTPCEFIIVSADGVKEERMEELADATAENPVDATFLLQNPNFNRNDQRVSAWVVTFTEGNNSNLNGGNQVNNCAESYHAAFNVMQTVSGAPAGNYAMTAQGFYRQDDDLEENAPVFFVNGVNKEVPAKTGTEDSMSDASASFTNGNYTIESIDFKVESEGDDAGKIYIGVTTESIHQWVIFDNFRLTYYGPDQNTDAITELKAETSQKAIYNLNGQKVMKAQKGLYITNGKKVAVK